MGYHYGELWVLTDDHTRNISNPALSGSCSAQALPLTEEQAARLAKRKISPFGFALAEKPKRKRS